MNQIKTYLNDLGILVRDKFKNKIFIDLNDFISKIRQTEDKF